MYIYIIIVTNVTVLMFAQFLNSTLLFFFFTICIICLQSEIIQNEQMFYTISNP